MKLLLPVDGSASALEAVHFAIRLVREGLQANVVLANVQEPAHFYEMVLAPDADVLAQAAQAAGAHALESAAALLSDAGIEVETDVALGDPAHTLVDTAERFGCDAVIMSARGHGALRNALLGSVSQSVLQAAGVPVTIVHPRTDDGSATTENDAAAGEAE